MDINDDLPKPPPTAKDALLDELESIKGLLDDYIDFEGDTETNIPVLSDIVKTGSKPTTVYQPWEEHPDAEASEQTDQHSNSPPELNAPVCRETDDEVILSEFNLDGIDTNVPIPAFNLQQSSVEATQAQSTGSDEAELFSFPDEYSDDSVAPKAISSDAAENPNHRYESVSSVQHPPTVQQKVQLDELPTMKTATMPAMSMNDEQENLDLDLLIQEVVDEMIPTLENALRTRLSRGSAELIKRMAERIDHESTGKPQQ